MRRFVFPTVCIGLLAVLIPVVTLVQSNWYHFIASGETPQNLVNQQGWEPVPGMETRNGVALNYRRPRFLPHPNVEPLTGPSVNVPSPAVKAIHSKASALASAIRSFAIYDHPPASDKSVVVTSDYTSLRNAYAEFAMEVDMDGDTSSQAAAARALIPQLKQAIETAYGTVNNAALVSLAVQLDHI